MINSYNSVQGIQSYFLVTIQGDKARENPLNERYHTTCTNKHCDLILEDLLIKQ